MRWLWVFPGIGIALLAIAIALQVHRHAERADMLGAEGRVVRVSSRKGCFTIEFVAANGQRVVFPGKVCSGASVMGRNKPVPVLYDAADPQHAHLDQFLENWFFSLVLSGIGAVFLAIGGFLALVPMASTRRGRRLRDTGQLIHADLIGVERNDSLSVNDRIPWRILAQWLDPETGKRHVFRSRNLWVDPQPHLPAAQVRVWIDPRRPGRYSMDTGFVPKRE